VYLYKYVASERIDILINKSIRFTQPENFNDPFELLPVFKKVFDEETYKVIDHKYEITKDLDITSNEKLTEMIRAYLPEELRPLEDFAIQLFLNNPQSRTELNEGINWIKTIIHNLMTGNNPDLMKKTIEKVKYDANQKYGILCLSETWKNLTMWAHYTQSYKGFVISFNTEHDYFLNSGISNPLLKTIQKMRYSDQREEMQLFSLNAINEDKMDEIVFPVFFKKSNYWKYEKEWRYLKELKNHNVVINKNNEDVYLFSFPPQCIKEIILGCCMEESKKAEIIEILTSDKEYGDVEVFQTKMHNSDYALEKEKIL